MFLSDLTLCPERTYGFNGSCFIFNSSCPENYDEKNVVLTSINDFRDNANNNSDTNFNNDANTTSVFSTDNNTNNNNKTINMSNLVNTEVEILMLYTLLEAANVEGYFGFGSGNKEFYNGMREMSAIKDLSYAQSTIAI